MSTGLRFRSLHAWDVVPTDAVAIQRSLRDRIVLRGPTHHVRLVAGVDVSYSKGSDRFYGGIVVLRLPDLETVDEAHHAAVMRFPYVPGLLSFRELPVLEPAFAALRTTPDAVICDAHGVAHPRGLGLASHLGLLLDRPTIGCAKSRLVGEHGAPGPAVGEHAPLRIDDRVVGSVLRTRRGVRPVFVSPGHRVGLAPARRLVLRCLDGVRLPEPTRRAHHLVNAVRRASEGG